MSGPRVHFFPQGRPLTACGLYVHWQLTYQRVTISPTRVTCGSCRKSLVFRRANEATP